MAHSWSCGRLLALLALCRMSGAVCSLCPQAYNRRHCAAPSAFPGRGGIQLQKRITGCQIIAPNSTSRVPLSGGAARADVCGRLLALLAPCLTSAAMKLRLCSPICQILLLLLRHLQSPAATIKKIAAVEPNLHIISHLFLTIAIHCRYHKSVHYRGNKFALPRSKPVLP